MNDLLVNWGVPANWANAFDEIIVAGLLIALALVVNGLGRAVFVRGRNGGLPALPGNGTASG